MTATSVINDPNNIDDDIKITKTLRDYYNFEEWYKSSRLRDNPIISTSPKLIYEFNSYDNQKMNVYNAGNIPSDL
jgi:hypothetical protein